jgi:putative sterol carrier protein
MADADSIRNELTTALNGKSLSLDGTVKFDFEPGIVYIDGSTDSASVSDEDKDADCTVVMSVDTWEKLKNEETDSTTEFMNGRIKVQGSLETIARLTTIFDSVK